MDNNLQESIVSTNQPYDLVEMSKRMFKYLVYALVVGMAVKYVPAQKLTTRETIMIAVIAAITFAILDMYTPTVDQSY